MAAEKKNTHDTITVTEQQMEIARQGIMAQVQWHGVDMEAAGVRSFVEQMIKNHAAHMAWHVFNNKILHKGTFE